MKSKLAAAALFLLLAAAARAEVDLFPRPNEIFPVLIADPRHIQLSGSYYRLNGANTSDIALGHSWGITRWRSGTMQDWLWESDIEGMAYSRFRVSGGINEFETVDFFANLPVTVRRGDVAFKGMLYHESSHLGDDYIRRTGDEGFRSSNDGLRLQAEIDPTRWLRPYAGAQYILHLVPPTKAWTAQAGLEITGADMRWSKEVPTNLYAAEDLQSVQNVHWNLNTHTVAGVKIGFRESPSRDMRLQVGYFDGHSPYGQFYAQRTHYLDFSLSFEL